MNLLLQIGIDSGIVGGETYPCPMDSTETTFHPDPFDCTHYYKCDQGVSTSLKCEEKEGYDNVTQKCIPSEDVPLCKELPFDPGKSIHIELHATCMDMETIVSNNGNSIHFPDFKCASSGLHANPKDCQKYYICANGRGYAITCAADNNFDAALRLCVPKAKSLCLPISKQE
jgi:hypothetical protein